MKSTPARLKSRVLAALAAVLLTVSLTGCAAERFDSPADGEAFLLERLEEKYGEEFIMATEGTLEGDWYARFFGTVAPASAPEHQAFARIDSVDRLSDAWAVWQFPELWAAADNMCAMVEGETLNCDVRPKMRATATTWTSDVPISQFFEEAQPYVQVQVELHEQDPLLAAERIHAMAETLESGPYTSILYVTFRGNYVFTHTEGDPIPTAEEIAMRYKGFD